MPTPTNFEGINPRGTQTFIPCKDVSAVDWSSYAKTGVHNLFVFPNNLTGGKDINGTIMTSYADSRVVIDGQNTGNAYFRLTNKNTDIAGYLTTLFYLPKGSYKFALRNADGSVVDSTANLNSLVAEYVNTNDVDIELGRVNSPNDLIFTFTIDDTVVSNAKYKDSDGNVLVSFTIIDKNNFDYDNLVVYPILSLAADNSTDITPYALTNLGFMDRLPKVTTVTATTSANGNINLSIDSTKYVILSIFDGGATDYLFSPIRWGGTTWGAHVTKGMADNSAITNTEVTAKVFYAKL